MFLSLVGWAPVVIWLLLTEEADENFMGLQPKEFAIVWNLQ